MRMRPSTSKPSWVSQLKKAMTRLPFGRMRTVDPNTVVRRQVLQGGEAEEEVREVADDDQAEASGEAEANPIRMAP